jgi:peroxiredoxin
MNGSNRQRYNGFLRLQRWLYVGCLCVGSLTQAAEPTDFSMRTLTGEVIRLSEQRGSVVVMGFWARWCGDCRQAMQALDAINDKYQRAGLLTLGVNVGDSAEQAAAMTRSLGLKFPVLIDVSQSASSQFNLKTMPLIVLIDRDGKLRYSHQGFSRGDELEVASQLHQLLNE